MRLPCASCLFVNNAAKRGAAIFNGGDGTANFTARNSTFRNNEADHTGGAIDTFSGSSGGEANPTFNNVTFEGNRAAVDAFAGSEFGGGAIWNNAFNGGTANPSISDSEFRDNRAVASPSTDTADGGGIYNSGGDLTVQNTTFENNFAQRAGGAVFSIAPGYSGGDVHSTISGSEFSGNTAARSGAIRIGGFRGGTQNAETVNSLSITNTTFSGNQVVDTDVDGEDNLIGRKGGGGTIGLLAERGGEVDATLTNIDIAGGTGQDAQFGGAVLVAADTTADSEATSLARPTFKNVTIRNVSAERGGAVSIIGDEQEARPRFENVAITNAQATDVGGAVDVVGKAGNGNAGTAEPTFVNTTIAGNSASRGGAVYDSTSGEGTVAAPTFTNTILWGNTAPDSGPEVYNANNGAVTLTHSIVEGGDEGIDEDGEASGTAFSDGTNNLNQDPGLADVGSLVGSDGVPRTSDDGLNVTPDAPALDAGLNDSVSVSSDLTGAGRIQDLDRDGTSTVNIGAYEPVHPVQPTTAPSTIAVLTGAGMTGTVNPSGAETTTKILLSATGSEERTLLSSNTLSGAVSQRVDATARALKPDTEYEVTVAATNPVGTTTSTMSFRTPPAPNLQNDSGEQSATMRIKTNDNLAGRSQDVTVYARPGGNETTSYDEITSASDVGTSLEVTVPESVIEVPRGVDYYATISGPPDALTLPTGGTRTAQRAPFHFPVSFDTLAIGGGPFKSRSYRMVSVPGSTDVESALTATYGAYNPAVWRLLQWDASSGEYNAFEELDANAFDPGQAFWVKSKIAERPSIGPGTTAEASTPTTVELPPGWSQVGTPFGFSVPWDTIQAASSLSAKHLDGPITYRNGNYERAGALAPWRGYFVFNATSEPQTLTIPPTSRGRDGSSSRSASRAQAHASSKDAASYTLTATARTNAETQSVRMGLLPGAADGRDRLDVAQAPPVQSDVRLSVMEPVGERTVAHAGSFKPAEERGQTWRLRLSGGGDAPSTVQFNLSADGTLPTEMSRYVVDLSGEKRVASGAEFALDPGEEKRLRVIVGTERYAAQESKGVALSGYEDDLRGNYPNPFEQTTTLEYTLSEKHAVTLTVYDVLGRRVQTLVDDKKEAGLHTVQWKGQNRYGTPVGSGVYFVRMEAGTMRETQKVVRVR